MNLRILTLLAGAAVALVAVPAPAAALECVGVDGECIYPPVVCVTEPCGPDYAGDGLEVRPGVPANPAYEQPVCVTEPCGPWLPWAVQKVLDAATPCVTGTSSCVLPLPDVGEPADADLPPLPPVKPLPCVFGSNSDCIVTFDCVMQPCEPEHLP